MCVAMTQLGERARHPDPDLLATHAVSMNANIWEHAPRAQHFPDLGYENLPGNGAWTSRSSSSTDRQKPHPWVRDQAEPMRTHHVTARSSDDPGAPPHGKLPSDGGDISGIPTAGVPAARSCKASAGRNPLPTTLAHRTINHRTQTSRMRWPPRDTWKGHLEGHQQMAAAPPSQHTVNRAKLECSMEACMIHCRVHDGTIT